MDPGRDAASASASTPTPTAVPETPTEYHPPSHAPLSVNEKDDTLTTSASTTATITTPLDDSVVSPPADPSSPTGISSWSTGSDRQLGHSGHGNQDLADRVFPIRSVISVDPAWKPGQHPAISRPMPSISEGGSVSKTTPRQQAGGISEEGTNAPPRRPEDISSPESLPVTPIHRPVSTPAGERARQRRMNTVSGSLTSIQADAERHGTITPMPLSLADSSDDDSIPLADTPSETQQLIPGRSENVEDALPESLYTHRFKHVVTSEGHAVITGRDGTLQRCEDEPIHTPGAIQGFGLMIALHEEDDGRFQVRYVSENSRRIIGYSPHELFQMNDFLDILTDEQADNLLDHIDFIRDEDSDPATNGPEVFGLSVRPPGAERSVKLWCAIHINPARADLVVCEMELDDDHLYPLRPVDEDTPTMPEDTLHSNPTLEELTESTEILSKPLRVLRSARKRRGEAGAMQVFDIMSQVQEQLAKAPNLERFLKILVGIVKELTGFHRVMIYQFDSSFNGKVVTELVDPSQTRDLYKGLHFPATDIPRQARELYKINKVRLLYDRDLETARIVCKSVEDLETPLDMTHSYLRAMSPIHLKYLANMAVRSSMSISINAFGDLWGLIACHSYGAKGMRVSFPIRKMCRLVGDTVSRNIERLSYASRLQARKLINTVPTEHNPSGYIIASSDDLLKLFSADFGMLSIREETKILGKLGAHSQEALAMLEYLRLRKFTSVVMTQDIKVDFPDLRYPPGFSVIAGLLYVPLSVGGNDFIVFFREGQARQVKWAGNPYEKTIHKGTKSYLEPRKSFKAWHETVLGKCREWTEEQVETAAVLCLVYGKFIEVWRQKEAALQSSRLTRLLLANSAHEVRTPLNAIINYLEIALEGSLDKETRDNLARSHSASKSLIYVINDLLDLTKTEKGQELVKDEIFDLPACIREGTEPFQNDAKRKGIAYEVIEHPGLPRLVYGDQRRVRQAVANVTANAVQHTSEGCVRVEMYVAEVKDRRVRVEIVVQDTGEGMTDTQLDALFRDLEQVSTDLDDPMFPPEKEDNSHQRILGLGLAIVARILRNMDGQLRLKSEPGKGSRFVMQLPFDLPEEAGTGEADGVESSTDTAAVSRTTSVSAAPVKPHDGEVTLVNRGSISSSTAAGTSHRISFDEQSISSQRSATSKGSARSGLSDAERLIDAIQTPLGLGEPAPERVIRQRLSQTGLFHNSEPAGLGSLSPPSTSPTKSRSVGPLLAESPALLNSTLENPIIAEPTGVEYMADEKLHIKPIRIPDDDADNSSDSLQTSTPRFHFDMHNQIENAAKSPIDIASTAGNTRQLSAKLRVLVAEDDPVNVKVLRKRLEKAGHNVSHALNGEDCATVYGEAPGAFDVVLMDMQMPIVDGLSSTKMIRTFELSRGDNGPPLSALAARHGRIPIIAVSASLVESKKDIYVEAGFDGWILKPIDFKRLETLLLGIVDDQVRDNAAYVAGEWEKGGWFDKKRAS